MLPAAAATAAANTSPWVQAGAAAAGGAAVSTAQGLVGTMFAKRNTRIALEANKKLADYQYSKDVEMWNRANEYNTPQAQMKRLTDAGLNPALVYGNGSAANTTSTTLPKYQAPTASYNAEAPNIAQALQSYQDFRLRQAQIDQVNANTKIAETEATWRDIVLRARIKNMYRDIDLKQMKFLPLADAYEAAEGTLYDLHDWDGTDWSGMPQGYRDVNRRKLYTTLLRGSFDAKQKLPVTQLVKTQADAERAGYQADIARLTKEWFTFDQFRKLFGGMVPRIKLPGKK